MKGVLVYRPMLKSPSGKPGLYTFEFEPFDAYEHAMVKTCQDMLIKKMPSLKDIELSSTNVTDAELLNFLLKFRGLTQLERLGLVVSNTTVDGFKRLQRALPNCQIDLCLPYEFPEVPYRNPEHDEIMEEMYENHKYLAPP